MPTTTTETVTVTSNPDGSFTCAITTNAVETVQITQAEMISFLQSEDTTPTSTPSVAPTVATPATTT